MADFARTRHAAGTNNRWEIVEAITADARAAGWKVLSFASIEAAAEALREAGAARTFGSVARLVEVAGYDRDATPEQSAVFRRYSPAAVHRFYADGWTQADAALFLGAEHRNADAQRAELERRRQAAPINDVLHRRLHEINRWFTSMHGDAARAECEGGLDAYSAVVIELYRIFTRKRLDAELRQLLDEEGARPMTDRPTPPPDEPDDVAAEVLDLAPVPEPWPAYVLSAAEAEQGAFDAGLWIDA